MESEIFFAQQRGDAALTASLSRRRARTGIGIKNRSYFKTRRANPSKQEFYDYAKVNATAGGLRADPTEVPWFVNDSGRYDVDSDVSVLLPEGICDWTRGLYTDYADHDLKQTKKVIRTMKDRTTTVDFALPVTVLKIILWPTRLRRPHVNFDGIGLGEHPTLQFRAQSTRK